MVILRVKDLHPALCLLHFSVSLTQDSFIGKVVSSTVLPKQENVEINISLYSKCFQFLNRKSTCLGSFFGGLQFFSGLDDVQDN